MPVRILTPQAEVRALWAGCGLTGEDLAVVAATGGLSETRVRSVLTGGAYTLDDMVRTRDALRHLLAARAAAPAPTTGKAA
jgi:hypothetical protein